jgi:hypothetical protein
VIGGSKLRKATVGSGMAGHEGTDAIAGATSDSAFDEDREKLLEKRS